MRIPDIRGLPLFCAVLALAPIAGARGQDLTDANGRAISVYNFTDTSVSDANGRNVSTYNFIEVSITDAVGREVTNYNPVEVVIRDAVGRELTAFNPPPDEPLDAIGRELTSYVPPYTLDEALSALHIAAGFRISDADNAIRLDVIHTDGSQGKIELPDAAKILRLALGLDP
ncbi:MAG: hypothetical protein GYA63_08900 [Armatimonadetes bacterium]|jgi:hypothetical protein|nr:hypothetical protein [Armatimonadota bacterium]